MVVVIKIGGSLANHKKSLLRLCHKLISISQNYKLHIVPGGGKFSDTVRYFYTRFKISNEVAHQMAILGMDQYGLLLKDIIGDAFIIRTIDDMTKKDEKISIILPSRILFSLNTLDHSWDVTSDSISAFFASLFKANYFFLLKDVDGIFTGNPANKNKPNLRMFKKISAYELLEKNFGCVDSYLPKILIEKKLTGYIINGKNPERLQRVLDGEDDIFTEISPFPVNRIYI